MKQIGLILLLLVCLSSKAQDALFNQFTVDNGLSSNRIYSVIEDRYGRIWFSSDSSLSVLEGFDFQTYPSPANNDALVGFSKSNSQDVWSYNTSGQLYTLKGLRFNSIAVNENISQKIGSHLINGIAVDKQNNIWVSVIIGPGLFRLNSNSLKIDDLSDEIIESTYWVKEVEKGLFISGSNKEATVSESILSVSLLKKNLEIPLSGKGGFSKSKTVMLRNGSFLFSAGSELVHFNQTEVISRLFTEKNIETVLEDAEGKIWIGLLNGGLLCFPTGQIASNNRIEYLGNTSVTDIYEDSQQNLWITTNGAGVYSYNVNPVLTYKSPEIFEGDDTTEVRKLNAIVLDQDPNLLTLERVFWDTVPPEIFISSIEINNKDTVLLDQYELNANQNFLKLGFVGSLPGNPGVFQYRYKLNGVDNDWVYSSMNTVTYPMLPAGKYLFSVSAMSKEGLWSKKNAEVRFVIHPYFYQTLWFRGSIAGLFLLLIGLIVFLYTRNVKEKEAEKAKVNKRIADLELMALRAQMNPHFLFNTLSSIQHFVSANNTEEALRYLSKFAKLMRVVLDNSKRKEISINDELNAIQLYLDLEKLRFKNKFDYTIDIGEGIDPSYDEIPSMLIQPYLENAILHGINNKREIGHIWVKLSHEGDNIVCRIEDDGVGRSKAAKMQENRSKEHKSQGMNITRDRLSIINRVTESGLSVVVEDLFPGQENTGTRVIIYVPFKNY